MVAGMVLGVRVVERGVVHGRKRVAAERSAGLTAGERGLGARGLSVALTQVGSPCLLLQLHEVRACERVGLAMD